jgi:hypothetical protein
MELQGDMCRIESYFILFGDSDNLDARRCTVCAEHTIGLEIILDTLDGTPRWQGSSENLFRSIWR